VSLTPDGAAIMAGLLAGQLQGGELEVSDGNGSADRAELTAVADAAVVACRAVFGEQQANFEWRVRRVLDPAGQVVDEQAEDMGRKAPGAIWPLEVDIEVGTE
jgi:hypothetical protein